MLGHWGAFFLGGSTFIAGTTVLFFPDIPQYMSISAALYTVGSLGFLMVDVMEFFTFTDDLWLRTNIACSMSGSLAYVIGSIGFFPSIYEQTSEIGIWGFILGSLLIGLWQLWILHRIGTDSPRQLQAKFKVSNLCGGLEPLTAFGVEFNACLGAWLFLVGTIM